MSDEDLKKLIESNARAIEALTDNFASFQKEWQKYRRGIYQLLGQLTCSISDFYEVQSDFYGRFDQIEERQAKMTEILERLSPHENQE